MFIKTLEGKLQNLYLLQTVDIVENDDSTYSIGYIQKNGEIIKEGSYSTKLDAENDLSIIKNSLI